MEEQNELKKVLNQTQNKLAEGISTVMRSINNKEEIINYLTTMEKPPTIEMLKRINRIAIEKEDFETCQALIEYSNQKGITL